MLHLHTKYECNLTGSFKFITYVKQYNAQNAFYNFQSDITEGEIKLYETMFKTGRLITF